jgi:hypothetical protein
MVNFRTDKVLLVAPKIFSVQLLNGGNRVKHIASFESVFPTIYELAPQMIVFDYSYLDLSMKKTLRRIRTDPRCSKINVCCFKAGPNKRIDTFLKALGVNKVVYNDKFQNA